MGRKILNADSTGEVELRRRINESISTKRFLYGVGLLDESEVRSLDESTSSWRDKPIDEVDILRATLSKDTLLQSALETWLVKNSSKPMTHREMRASLFDHLAASDEFAEL